MPGPAFDAEIAAPMVLTRTEGAVPLPWTKRGIAAAVAAACLGVLLVAAWLRPDRHGTGTHTQLGMEACAFKLRTGLPCPSCGFTTAFTYFAHGNLLASLYTQPMGALLAMMTAVTVWVGFYIAFTGRPVHRLLKLLPSRYYTLPLMVLAVLGWAWKIVLTLTGHDGW
jgi:hypothetical protein